MSRNSNREPTKIVIINTEYVKADARNFKSVVQKLTGKDSTVAATPRYSAEGNFFPREEMIVNANGVFQSGTTHQMPQEFNKASFLRDLSFKEIDMFFKGLPPVDNELYGLLAD